MKQFQDKLPQGDTLVMLDDFKASVSMFDPADGILHRTIGIYVWTGRKELFQMQTGSGFWRWPQKVRKL